MASRRSWLMVLGMMSRILYPRAAATMASAMPVLPEVASMSRAPGTK